MRVINWLLEGDPAIRWQVLRDLLNASLTMSRLSEHGSSIAVGAPASWLSRLADRAA
jgi:hypothetical protein